MAEKEAPKPEKMSSEDRFLKDIYLGEGSTKNILKVIR